jgi:mutator protein MutT
MTPRVGLGAVVVRDGNILLIRRGRPPYAGLWSLPGGKLNMGETIAEALRREVSEETGLLIEVGDLAGIVESIDPEGRFHFVILDYFATVRGGRLMAGDDASDARWVSLQDLSDLSSTPKLLYYLHRFGVIQTRS